MQIKGKIISISELIEINSNFNKRELILLTEDDKYPQKLKFDFLNKSTAALNSLSADDNVEVHFNIRGSQYNDKYYTSLVGWKIQKGESNNPAKSSSRPVASKEVKKTVEVKKTASQPVKEKPPTESETEEDLTF